MKEYLKPHADKQSEHPARVGVTACLLKNEPASYSSVARLRQGAAGAGAKASPNRACLLFGSREQSLGVGPKPCDLPMARLKAR